jgi:hypothetical protein
VTSSILACRIDTDHDSHDEWIQIGFFVALKCLCDGHTADADAGGDDDDDGEEVEEEREEAHNNRRLSSCPPHCFWLLPLPLPLTVDDDDTSYKAAACSRVALRERRDVLFAIAE